jgi:hypothetical protein
MLAARWRAGAAPPAAAGPLAAGAVSPDAPRRLYWVPAVGPIPAIEHYRQHHGLEAIPLPPTAGDATAYLLEATQAQGRQQGEAAVADAAGALGGLDLEAG